MLVVVRGMLVVGMVDGDGLMVEGTGGDKSENIAHHKGPHIEN